MENGFPIRKNTRLNGYDYSKSGVYFITICVEQRKQILSSVIKKEGALPEIILKPCGIIAKEELFNLEKRYPVTIGRYAILPDHIHFILFLKNDSADPSSSIPNIMCTYKSLTSRSCKQKIGIEKVLQRSYNDHIIRNKEDYKNTVNYICNNPIKWYYEHL